MTTENSKYIKLFEANAKIEYSKGVLRAVLPWDFSRYYKKLFSYFCYNTVRMAAPRYAPHISIFIPEFHQTKENLEKYIEKMVKIEYSPEEVYLGGKAFLGYYWPIYSEDIKKIRNEIGVENNYINRLHLCLFNNKAFIKTKQKK